MYEQIKNMILSKKSDIDSQTLSYFTNYFYVLVLRNEIPEGITLEEIIDTTLAYAQGVVFYDDNSDAYEKLGPDVKGLRDPETKNIYIRNNLGEPLREIVVYHELHHAAQTNKDNNEVGINQSYNVGRMIMEAQTQWFAEEVYKTIHHVEFEKREIPTEQLRMLPNGTVLSSLHNYEMYDAMLSKLAIILDVPKDYFVSINFQFDKGLKLLEEKYNEKVKEKKWFKPFYDLLYKMDYIYVVDYMAYINGDDKDTILKGEETESKYEIYKNIGDKLSLCKQKEYINDLDCTLALALIDNGLDYEEFLKYIIYNDKKKIFCDFAAEAKNVR